MAQISDPDIDSEQLRLCVYPGFGFETGDQQWRISLSGIAFHRHPWNRRQKMLVRMLASRMKASEAELDCSNFRDRIWPFFAEPEKGQTIELIINDRRWQLKKKTRRNGRFATLSSLPDLFINDSAIEVDGRRVLPCRVAIAGQTGSEVDATVRLLPRHGLSIVSDIDDTIKESFVANRRELLLNTFLKDFRYVDGMADAYRRWYGEGADFHYVSSSPWQLFAPLTALQETGGFPAGTFHLRNFRLRDQFLKKVMLIRRKGKSAEIKRLVRKLRDRKFILIGDSGEQDLEIYSRISRWFESQVVGIFIRNLPEAPVDRDRMSKLERVVAASQCECRAGLFRNADELRHLADSVVQQFSQPTLALSSDASFSY